MMVTQLSAHPPLGPFQAHAPGYDKEQAEPLGRGRDVHHTDAQTLHLGHRLPVGNRPLGQRMLHHPLVERRALR